MKPDIYTKFILTVIAIMLTAIACNQYIDPAATAQAQAPFSGVLGTLPPLSFFDTRTGEVFIYGQYPGVAGQQQPLQSKRRLTKLGQPLLDEYESER
jgi:hypothetical protein